MRILVVKPRRKPEIQEINDTLESMQEVVGGLIQAIYPFDELVALIANDEGKLLSLSPNRGLRDENGQLYDILCGTFFLCGISEDHFTSLSDNQIQYFEQVYDTPEMFLNLNGHIIVLPYEETP